MERISYSLFMSKNVYPFEFKIHYNRVGYLPKFPKRFLCAVSKNECKYQSNLLKFFKQPEFVIKNSFGKIVYRGILSEAKYASYTEEFTFLGDFSELKEEGFFQIKILGFDELKNTETPFFEISNQWIFKELQSNIKSFYYQRSGFELTEKFAGKWNRPLAHKDDCLEFHQMMNRKGVWNAAGGWYDAGDYGKYIVNGGVSLFTLLLVCKLCESENFVGFKHFESSFSQPFSLLEEAKFEIDFFLKMQDEDGGVFFKVSPKRWDAFVSPTESDFNQKRLILGKSTTSALNFAATLAFASDVFKNYDSEFAEKCKSVSLKAYAWAKENNAIPFPNNTEGSGPYADWRFEDEFFWTRAVFFALGILPPEEESLFEQDKKKLPPKFGADWRDTENLGWMILGFYGNEFAQKTLQNVAEEIIKKEKSDAYGISLESFRWGSNGDIANHSLTLALAYYWTRKPKYLKYALNGLDFIYGKNPISISFVTGSANDSPKFPHHRLSHSDGVEEPIPGLLVGGINADRQDIHRRPHYPSHLPGFSYSDKQCSFASNETAINWNAPLLALQALLFLFSKEPIE